MSDIRGRLCSFYNCTIQMSKQIFVFNTIFNLIECHFVFKNIPLKVPILSFILIGIVEILIDIHYL